MLHDQASLGRDRLVVRAPLDEPKHGEGADADEEAHAMDDDYVRAVMTFFVRLYEKGWIYRANRIVNWCPYHQTSLSDLEVAHVEVDDGGACVSRGVK